MLSNRHLFFLIVASAAAAVVGLMVFKKLEPNPVAAEVAASQRGFVDDAARRAYVDAFVSVRSVAIGPDQKPGDAGIVPGLLQVHGVVANEGDQPVDDVRLVVHLKDDSDEVVLTLVDDILDGRTLEPGKDRPFSFQIPDEKAFAGKFDHTLR